MRGAVFGSTVWEHFIEGLPQGSDWIGGVGARAHLHLPIRKYWDRIIGLTRPKAKDL